MNQRQPARIKETHRMSSDRDDGGSFTQDCIDERLERLLRAAGSSLQHYTPPAKEELRKTMRKLLEDVRALAAYKREDGERVVGKFSHE
jgi:hypothetical protein